MSVEPDKVRRVVIALDTASSALTAIEAAAGLALGLQAELSGLFVEDERLLRFAGLPFAREFGHASARGRPLQPAAVEHALRAQAEQLRRLLSATAERLSLSWTLEVVRGQMQRSAPAHTGTSDLLVLGRSEHAWPGSVPRSGPGARFPALAAHPVGTVFDGSVSAQRALSIAATLAEVTESRLQVLVPSADDAAFRSLRRLAITQIAEPAGAAFLTLEGCSPETALRAARSRKLGVLLWPGRVEDFLPAQLADLPCPLVVLN